MYKVPVFCVQVLIFSQIFWRNYFLNRNVTLPQVSQNVTQGTANPTSYNVIKVFNTSLIHTDSRHYRTQGFCDTKFSMNKQLLELRNYPETVYVSFSSYSIGGLL
jgi:hypothetical protein